MRPRVRWRDPGSKVSRLHLHGRSRGQTRARAEGPGSVQGEGARHHATGQRRQHRDDDSGTGSVYAGLAQLFRLLRNAGGAGLPDSLGPTATASGFVAAVENTTPSPGGFAGAGGPSATGQSHGRQRSRSLVPRPGQGPLGRAVQCVLRFARTSAVDRRGLA